MNPAWKLSAEVWLKIMEELNPSVTKVSSTNWIGLTARWVLTGFRINDIPNIRPMLATFEPVILPKTKPLAPELIAEIEVNSSGAEVATETMVSPTMTGGTPSFLAKIEQ